MTSHPVTLANAQKAIAVFEATLITPNAPFDRYLKGDASALTLDAEARPAAVHGQGLRRMPQRHQPRRRRCTRRSAWWRSPGADLLPPADKGRFTVTKTASDEYVFKVPTLRNIALTAPYFHTGRSWDLRQATAVMGASQLGAHLTPDETEKLALFFDALTGEQPKIVHPMLPPSVAATPRPQP